MTEIRKVITQGQRMVSDDPNITISTLLGSCVACCLWDPVVQAGGMNHMLIAKRVINDTQSALAGVNEMELLINDLQKLGAIRERLQAKVFGGARMVSGLSDIGPANCAFTLEFLARENINCVAQSLGGETARQLLFRPSNGTVRQRIQRADVLPAPVLIPTPQTEPEGNGLELL
jgi:chemotaxis protein CheD